MVKLKLVLLLLISMTAIQIRAESEMGSIFSDDFTSDPEYQKLDFWGKILYGLNEVAKEIKDHPPHNLLMDQTDDLLKKVPDAFKFLDDLPPFVQKEDTLNFLQTHQR